MEAIEEYKYDNTGAKGFDLFHIVCDAGFGFGFCDWGFGWRGSTDNKTTRLKTPHPQPEVIQGLLDC